MKTFYVLALLLCSNLSASGDSLAIKIHEITTNYYAEQDAIIDYIELNKEDPNPIYQESIINSRGKIEAYLICLQILLRSDKN